MVRFAAFVKQEDPNHLLTVGEDGFYGCCKAPANPGVRWSEWAAEEGQNFIADHASPHIDFASFHGWGKLRCFLVAFLPGLGLGLLGLHCYSKPEGTARLN